VERLVKENKVGWLGGVVIDTDDGRMVFDPAATRNMERDAHIFISHAHSDHTLGFQSSVMKYSTKETKRIFEKLRERSVRNWRPVEYAHKIRIGDTEILPLNAGHMLGSAQFQVITRDNTYVYTGDLNCINTLTTEAAEIPECDTLIVEATYGDPSFIFPRRERTYARIVNWALREVKNGRMPTFHVYSSGKSQEIVRLFNVYTKLPVVCASVVGRANEVYNEAGADLSFVEVETAEGRRLLRKGSCVYVTTTGSNSSVPDHASEAMATGWAVRFSSGSYASFPLSSHAGFDQLVKYVARTGAKRVYIFTGYSELISDHLRKELKVKADPLPLLSQRSILDF
jgi:putative mRNA 3-end processing factor